MRNENEPDGSRDPFPLKRSDPRSTPVQRQQTSGTQLPTRLASGRIRHDRNLLSHSVFRITTTPLRAACPRGLSGVVRTLTREAHPTLTQLAVRPMADGWRLIPAACRLARLARYCAPVSRITCSSVVMPLRTLSQPSMRRVSIPSSIAPSRISAAPTFCRIRRRRRGVMNMTS